MIRQGLVNRWGEEAGGAPPVTRPVRLAYPEGVKALVADPPWAFGDKLPGPGRGAAKHYPTMTVEQIKAYPMPEWDAKGAWLFLWRVASMQQEALDVVKAWGFTPKTEMVWVKQTRTGKAHFGMGRYLRASHETCIVATRGRVQPNLRNVRSVFYAQTSEHSTKPDEFYDIVRSLVDEPRVELFARRPNPGFHQHGNEL